MSLYSPTEITAKIKGLDARQLNDLATKKIIKPAKETPGQGSSRMYNKKNILQIMVAIAVRGKLSIKLTKKLINLAVNSKKKWFFFQEDVDHKLYLFHPSDEPITTLPIISADNPAWEVVSYEMNSPQAFTFFSIDIGGMKEFIKNNF